MPGMPVLGWRRRGLAFAEDNFGPGCADVPADVLREFRGDGCGSVATAASNNPALSTWSPRLTPPAWSRLNSEEALTVFAPANSAFEAIPKETLDTLLADPTGDLATILKVHVVAGKMSADRPRSQGRQGPSLQAPS
ncbi:MAG: fasciclin domain-containing protein [Candidatus Microthrix sp.]|nr:fasciclin domain-containing protein [Candidatus Microthrix sp.]